MGICEELISIDRTLPSDTIRSLVLEVCKRYPNTTISWSKNPSVVIDRIGTPWFFQTPTSIPHVMKTYVTNGVIGMEEFRIVPVMSIH